MPNTNSAELAAAVKQLGELADALDVATNWGAEVRLPADLAPVLQRLIAYTDGPHATVTVNPVDATKPDAEPAIVGTDLVIQLISGAPDKVWSLPELVDAMTERGWSTSSDNERGVVANTVNKAMKRLPDHIVAGPRRGTYTWVSDPLPSTQEGSGPTVFSASVEATSEPEAFVSSGEGPNVNHPPWGATA
jgi:hypothetical protein